jgi:hypothetical protein
MRQRPDRSSFSAEVHALDHDGAESADVHGHGTYSSAKYSQGPSEPACTSRMTQGWSGAASASASARIRSSAVGATPPRRPAFGVRSLSAARASSSGGIGGAVSPGPSQTRSRARKTIDCAPRPNIRQRRNRPPIRGERLFPVFMSGPRRPVAPPTSEVFDIDLRPGFKTLRKKDRPDCDRTSF